MPDEVSDVSDRRRIPGEHGASDPQRVEEGDERLGLRRYAERVGKRLRLAVTRPRHRQHVGLLGEARCDAGECGGIPAFRVDEYERKSFATEVEIMDQHTVDFDEMVERIVRLHMNERRGVSVGRGQKY